MLYLIYFHSFYWSNKLTQIFLKNLDQKFILNSMSICQLLDYPLLLCLLFAARDQAQEFLSEVANAHDIEVEVGDA